MSRMLVAYEQCGCRAMALLSTSDEAACADFHNEAAEFGWMVREEEHPNGITSLRCPAHETPRPKDAA